MDPSQLASSEVHVWRIALRSPELRELENFLSADERQRAARFKFEKDRAQFAVTRGAVRHLLARYLDVAPAALVFSYTENGKPYVPEPLAAGLHFNVSHSSELAVCAVARHPELGIDIERIHTDFAVESIVERFFSSREAAEIRALPEAQRHAAFFACWTRKEAYLKASSRGLSLPLDKIDVTLLPDQPAAIRLLDDAPQETPQWFLQDLALDRGYAGALAIRVPDIRIRYWDLPHA